MKKCPTCKGTGKIPLFKKMPLERRISIATSLKLRSYTVREIMVIMNYKSPKSVQDLLTKYKGE